MNIKEMHIEVDLSMQAIASNVKRKFYPEEIDWILNKNISRFVKEKIKPNPQQKEGGFQDDGIDLNALRTLIELDYILPVFKFGPSDDSVRGEFPTNYSYLVEDRSSLVRSCEEAYKSIQFTSVSEFIFALPIKPTANTTSPFYQATSIKLNGVDIIPTTKFPTTLEDPSMGFVIEGVIQNYINQAKFVGYQCYWERYKSFYQQNSLILVAPANIGPLVFTTDGVATTAAVWNLTSYVPSSVAANNIKTNRLIRSSSIGKFQDSSFAKSQWLSPISNIQNNTLKIYHDNKFIVTRALINYIRKPRIVSLSLNESCDLPEEFHMDICDWTVEYMKNAINDPNYQWKVADNQLRRE